jgi:acyl-CoA synthetase (AMP-forming)/AMP-acid ligase II
MDLLSVHAAATPEKPAVIDDRRGRLVAEWSFAELERRANRLARLFAELGAGPGVKVVTVGHNSAGLLCASHALRKLGATTVPLNYRLTAAEATYVVDNSDATIAYADCEVLPLIDAVRAHVPALRHLVTFDEAGELIDPTLRARLAALPDLPLDPTETEGATMIYTSGTTGRPKGALRPSVRGGDQLAGLVRLIGYQPDDVYLTTGPLYHSGPGGFAGIAHALGNTIVVQHKFDPEDWLRLVERYRVTTTFTAPTPIRMICSLPDEIKARYDRSSMRRLIANAAPWTLALKQRYLADFPPDSLWEVYGSTELGVDTVLGPEDHLRKPGSCGRPAPGVELRIVDGKGEAVTDPYVHGELYVRAEGMFRAYHKAEDKFAASHLGDGFHTVGDIAYVDEEGYYYIADRKNDMIITGGMNVYPAEIEAALDACPEVYEVAVVGIPDEQWGESVHAFVVPSKADPSVDAIVSFARERLAGYKVPRTITFVGELPKTGSGKVLKRDLRARLSAAAQPGGASS